MSGIKANYRHFQHSWVISYYWVKSVQLFTEYWVRLFQGKIVPPCFTTCGMNSSKIPQRCPWRGNFSSSPTLFQHLSPLARQGLSGQYKKWLFLPPTHISLILDETYYIKGAFNVCKLFPRMEGMMHSQVFLHISVGCKLDWLMTCSHFPTYFGYRYSSTKDHSPLAKLWSQAGLRCAPPSSHHAQSILLVLILQRNFNLVDFVRDNLAHKDVSIHSYELVKLLAFSMWLELEKKLMLTVLGDVNASCLLTPQQPPSVTLKRGNMPSGMSVQPSRCCSGLALRSRCV